MLLRFIGVMKTCGLHARSLLETLLFMIQPMNRKVVPPPLGMNYLCFDCLRRRAPGKELPDFENAEQAAEPKH